MAQNQLTHLRQLGNRGCLCRSRVFDLLTARSVLIQECGLVIQRLDTFDDWNDLLAVLRVRTISRTQTNRLRSSHDGSL